MATKKSAPAKKAAAKKSAASRFTSGRGKAGAVGKIRATVRGSGGGRRAASAKAARSSGS